MLRQSSLAAAFLASQPSCPKDGKSLNSPSVSALLMTGFGCYKTFVFSLQPPLFLLYSWRRMGSQ